MYKDLAGAPYGVKYYFLLKEIKLSAQGIQQRLQNIRRCKFVHILGPFGAAHVSFDHGSGDRGGAQAFVPEDDGERRQLPEVSGESSGGLAARAFGAVHVQRQAQHDETDVFGSGKSNQ